MSTTTHLTFEDFRNLPEDDGKIYELDHGELLVTPSPTVSHNRIRDRIFVALKEFVDGRQLGEIMLEMDFRLESSTVRKPDVALVTQDHLARIDAESWPVNGAPALAVEVISPRQCGARRGRQDQAVPAVGLSLCLDRVSQAAVD
jgi:Uma2 family endonuclease